MLAESSAFGETGGRGARGWATARWCGPHRRHRSVDVAGRRHRRPAPFFDATTVFPDHVVGRITAIAALAGLIQRDRHTGDGVRIHISQAEAAINQLDTLFVTRSAQAEHPELVESGTASDGVYPCLGEDEWCVISLRSDAAPGRRGRGDGHARALGAVDERAHAGRGGTSSCSARGWRPRRCTGVRTCSPIRSWWPAACTGR